ncbi:hypothetical protein QAD02_001372, partial [Eretmocerus hayati]
FLGLIIMKNNKIRLILFYLSISLSCVEPLIGNSVRPALDKEFPFVVSIVDKSKDLSSGLPLAQRIFCGGTVVTTKHVLTIANCLRGKSSQQLQIFGGSSDIRLCDSYDVSSWKSYNKWALENGASQEYIAYDIAMITLSGNINQARIQPVLISPKPVNYFYGKIGTLVGWGDTIDGSTPEIMQTSSVRILNMEECTAMAMSTGTKVKIQNRKLLCSDVDPYVAK